MTQNISTKIAALVKRAMVCELHNNALCEPLAREAGAAVYSSGGACADVLALVPGVGSPSAATTWAHLVDGYFDQLERYPG